MKDNRMGGNISGKNFLGEIFQEEFHGWEFPGGIFLEPFCSYSSILIFQKFFNKYKVKRRQLNFLLYGPDRLKFSANLNNSIDFLRKRFFFYYLYFR